MCCCMEMTGNFMVAGVIGHGSNTMDQILISVLRNYVYASMISFINSVVP